jgi:cell division GTPase FtsZ
MSNKLNNLIIIVNNNLFNLNNKVNINYNIKYDINILLSVIQHIFQMKHILFE